MPSPSDTNGLLGILALQLGYVTREQLVAAMEAWVADKSRSLGEILVERGALKPEHRQVLEGLVENALSHGAKDSSGEPENRADSSLEEHDAQTRPANPSETSGSDESDDDRGDIRYRVIRRHKAGGLGIVYVAIDQEINREVALKEIRRDQANKRQSQTQFLLEAEITGRLEHPGVVPVYGFGRYPDGRPFYAMRLIKGETLKEAIDRYHAADKAGQPAAKRDHGLRELLLRFLSVCDAIRYAHGKGVVHRDLKPLNIMLGKYGETLVIDWGLAKSIVMPQQPSSSNPPLDASIALIPGSDDGTAREPDRSGSPPYMSPEQARGGIDQLAPTNDVYSLGATLYEILTGRPPLAGPPEEVLKRALRGDFPRPRSVQPTVPAPLEAICLKAMALETTDRYATVQELQDDAKNWLAGEPVSAWPEPWHAQAFRWINRHRSVSLAAANGLLLALALFAVLAFYFSAENERLKAIAATESQQSLVAEQKLKDERQELKNRLDKEERTRVAWQKYAIQLAAAEQQLRRHNAQAMIDGLLQTIEDHRGWEYGYLRTEATRRRLRTLKEIDGSIGAINEAVWSPDGASIAFADGNAIFLIDASDGRTLRSVKLHGRVNALAFHPRGGQLAIGNDSAVRIWDTNSVAASPHSLRSLGQHVDNVECVVWDDAGDRIASGSADGIVHVWKADGAALARELAPLSTLEADDRVKILAWNRTGDRLAIGLARGGVATADITAKKPTPIAGRIDAATVAVAWMGHSDVLIAAWDDGRFGRLQTGAPMTLNLATDMSLRKVNRAAVSPDGRIALACDDGAVRIVDPGYANDTLAIIPGVRSSVTAIAWNPDGDSIASGGGSGIDVWDAFAAPPAFVRHQKRVVCAAATRDGSKIASAGEEPFTRVWSPWTGDEVMRLASSEKTSRVICVAFSPEGNRLVAGENNGKIRLWNMTATKPLESENLHRCPVIAVAWLDGSRGESGMFASLGEDGAIRVWRTADMSSDEIGRLGTVTIHAQDFSPDGRRLAVATDNAVKIWDVESRRTLFEIPTPHRPIIALAWRGDGRQLALSDGSPAAQIWDTESRKRIDTLLGRTPITALAWHPSGYRLAIAGENGVITVWQPDIRQELLTLEGHAKAITCLVWTRDETHLVSGGFDALLRIWTARP